MLLPHRSDGRLKLAVAYLLHVTAFFFLSFSENYLDYVIMCSIILFETTNKGVDMITKMKAKNNECLNWLLFGSGYSVEFVNHKYLPELNHYVFKDKVNNRVVMYWMENREINYIH